MENAKILIVDDDRDIRDSLKIILENSRYNAITAPGVTEAMEKIRAEKPDLIILDVMMDSWTDGFDMARDLKKNNEYQNIPILMLTGIKNKTGIDFKATAGDPTWCPVDEFHEKPIEPDTLLKKVEELLTKKPDKQ